MVRGYTTIKQSRKLAEILPIQSSDMYWDLLSKDKYAKVNNIGHCLCRTCVYAWSLAALLGVLPEYHLSSPNPLGSMFCCRVNDIETYADNPIDACYEMIIRLHELNLL